MLSILLLIALSVQTFSCMLSFSNEMSIQLTDVETTEKTGEEKHEKEYTTPATSCEKTGGVKIAVGIYRHHPDQSPVSNHLTPPPDAVAI